MENTVKRMRDRKKKHHKPYTTSTSSLRMWEENMEQKQYWWDNCWKFSNLKNIKPQMQRTLWAQQDKSNENFTYVCQKVLKLKDKKSWRHSEEKMTQYQESNTTDTDFNKNRWSQKKIGYIFFQSSERQ